MALSKPISIDNTPINALYGHQGEKSWKDILPPNAKESVLFYKGDYHTIIKAPVSNLDEFKDVMRFTRDVENLPLYYLVAPKNFVSVLETQLDFLSDIHYADYRSYQAMGVFETEEEFLEHFNIDKGN